MKIKNNHKSTLGLPDGTHIAPGATETVADVALLKKNSVVQGWIKAKVLEFVEESADSDASSEEVSTASADTASDVVASVSDPSTDTASNTSATAEDATTAAISTAAKSTKKS